MSSRSLLALSGLTILFGVASLMVILSRGRNAFWIRRKLRFGAMLLSFSAAATAPGCHEPTCYDSTLNPYLLLALSSGPDVKLDGVTGAGEITVSLSGSREISGTVFPGSGTLFSVFVVTSSGVSMQALDLAARDGAFDSSEEAFLFSIDPAISAGTYRLLFFNKKADEVLVAQDSPLSEFVLHVEP